MKIILSMVLLSAAFPAVALVNCGPSDCSPACDSSCSYKVCEGSSVNVFTIGELPYTYVTPSNACQDSLNGQVFRVLPIKIADIDMSKMSPTQVRHTYKICLTKTKLGPACPPPP